MNFVQQFLAANWQRLSLDRFADRRSISSIMITPRFRSSSNVLFAVMASGQAEPFLIVKVPRLPDDHNRLRREANNLERAQARWSAAAGSVPSLIVCEEYAGSQLLVETAQSGQKLSSLLKNGGSQPYIESVVQWLIDFNLATKTPGTENAGWQRRLLEEPLRCFQEALVLSAEEQALVEKTQWQFYTLEESDIQLVFEHGDLGPPNILVADGRRPGVVDWELATPDGLPAVDLFFFLTLVGFAERGAKSDVQYVSAFHETFFGDSAWARPYVRRYAARMGLSSETLTALFVACWSRYVAGLVARLHDFDKSVGLLDSVTARWLRQNRYFSLWRHSIENLADLNIA